VRCIFKFGNGAEIIQEMNASIFPECFHWNTPEGVRFYFKYIDTLPNGTVWFKETTASDALKIWRGE